MVAAAKFNPLTDIPDLARKVIFITGGTAGLGKLSVIHLARQNPAHIYFSGRNASRAAEVIAEAKSAAPFTNVSFIKMDLASLKSVKAGANEFLSQNNRLDILMCNAGICCIPPALTEDGYEVQMGTNHLGHALLMKLLLPTMQKTAEETKDVRIISNASEAWQLSLKSIHYGGLKNATGPGFVFLGDWRRYGETKWANMLYAAEFARKYPGITSVSVHPGMISTDMLGGLNGSNRFMLKVMQFGTGDNIMEPEEGVLNQLWAATVEKHNLKNGCYYTPVAVEGANMERKSYVAKASKLWEWTEKELDGYNLSEF